MLATPLPAPGALPPASATVPLPLAVPLPAEGVEELEEESEELVEELEESELVEAPEVVVGGSATPTFVTPIATPDPTEVMFGTALTALLTRVAKVPPDPAVSRRDLTAATFPAGARTTAFTTTDPEESVTVTRLTGTSAAVAIAEMTASVKLARSAGLACNWV